MIFLSGKILHIPWRMVLVYIPTWFPHPGSSVRAAGDLHSPCGKSLDPRAGDRRVTGHGVTGVDRWTPGKESVILRRKNGENHDVYMGKLWFSRGKLWWLMMFFPENCDFIAMFLANMGFFDDFSRENGDFYGDLLGFLGWITGLNGRLGCFT